MIWWRKGGLPVILVVVAVGMDVAKFNEVEMMERCRDANSSWDEFYRKKID